MEARKAVFKECSKSGVEHSLKTWQGLSTYPYSRAVVRRGAFSTRNFGVSEKRTGKEIDSLLLSAPPGLKTFDSIAFCNFSYLTQIESRLLQSCNDYFAGEVTSWRFDVTDRNIFVVFSKYVV